MATHLQNLIPDFATLSYFEDPGLGWTLPVENEGTTPAGISDLIDRTAAISLNRLFLLIMWQSLG